MLQPKGKKHTYIEKTKSKIVLAAKTQNLLQTL